MSKNTTGILKYISSFSEPHWSIQESSGFQQVLSMLWITHHWSIWPPGHGPWIQVWTDPPQSAWCRSQLGCRLQKQNKPWIVNVKYGYGQTYQTSLLSNKPICSPALADPEIHVHHWKSPLKIGFPVSSLWLYSHLVNVFGTKPSKTQVHKIIYILSLDQQQTEIYTQWPILLIGLCDVTHISYGRHIS